MLIKKLQEYMQLRNYSRQTIKKSSPQTINQYHATLKLIFEKIYQIPFNFDTPYVKRVSKLPVVLSRGDVRYVQELLGHQNIRTTQRYTQVTNPLLKNIKSPL